MTAKEKAIELYEKFYDKIPDVNDLGEAQHESAKQCAIIAQQNLLKKLKELNVEDSFEEQVLFEINVLK
jgi:adenine-specific DNA glycosylase